MHTRLKTLNSAQSGSEHDPGTGLRYRQIGRCLSSGQHVLEIGCNTGRGGRVLSELGVIIHGLDLMEDRLQRMDLEGYSSRTCGSVTQLPFAPNSFHAVVLAEVLEHLPSHWLDSTLSECFRVLRLGGTIVATTPNPAGLPVTLTGRSVLDDPSHVSQHFPSALRRQLRAAGFRDIRTRGAGVVSSRLGTRLPLCLYGGYLIKAKKS